MAKYDDYDWDELPSEVKAAGKVYLLHIRDLLIMRSSPREEVEHRLTSFFLSPLNYYMQLPLLDSTSNFGTMMMNLMLATSECVYVYVVAPLTFMKYDASHHYINITSSNALHLYTQLLFCAILVVAILIVVSDGGRI